MPVVDVDPDELRALTSREKSDEQLRADLFDLGLEFEGRTEDGEFQLEFAPDRLDRLSVEGIARSLRYHYGDDRGVYVPSVNDAEWAIEVEDPPAGRPYVTGAVVRGLDFGDGGLESLIQLQEKLHATMGRQRAKGAVGVHDLTMLKGREARASTDLGPIAGSGAETADPDADDPEVDDAGTRADDGRAGSSGDGRGDDMGARPRKSVRYTAADPGETFVPLESDAELSLAEVLTEHPTGERYADLVEEFDRYPAIYDSIGLFSFPPVINGRRTEVTTGSRDLFIEMTGTDQWTIDRMLNIVCYALSARGGQVERVDVRYADDAPGEYAGRTLSRPDLSLREKTVAHDRIESILGVDLDPETVIDCAERAGLDADLRGDDAASLPGGDTDGDAGPDAEGDDTLGYEVSVPPYRVDVLHPLDVVDDVGRAYGFNELDPRYPDVSTVGGRTADSRLEDAARDALVSLGFEDLLNFHMTNEHENFERVGLPLPDGSSEGGTDGWASTGEGPVGGAEPVTIREPYSEDYTILRTWALPSLLMVLENNTHRAYPQHLAEIGLAARVDPAQNTGVAEHRTVAAVLASTDVSYEDARARLQAVAGAFGTELSTPATTHPTFVDGRTAEVVLDGDAVGVVGEVHPAVLVEHDLELPVAAFEFRLDGLR